MLTWYEMMKLKRNLKQQHIAMYVNNRFDDKVRDHCHFTGPFRGAAHSQCNWKYKIDKQRYKLPIVFHNLRGYDAHLIFQKINPQTPLN